MVYNAVSKQQKILNMFMCTVISKSFVSMNQQCFDKTRQKLELNSFFSVNN